MEEYRSNSPVSSLKQQMYRAYGVLGMNKPEKSTEID